MTGVGGAVGTTVGGVFNDAFNNINNSPTQQVNVSSQFCEECGAKLFPGVSFCDECGYPVKKMYSCTKCGYIFERQGKYCPKCGQKREG